MDDLANFLLSTLRQSNENTEETAPRIKAGKPDFTIGQAELRELKLSNDAVRVLMIAGVTSIERLRGMNGPELLTLPNMTVQLMAEIRKALDQRGKARRHVGLAKRESDAGIGDGTSGTGTESSPIPLLARPVAHLDLPTGYVRALARAGVHTIGELTQLTGEDLEKRLGFGAPAARVIERMLSKNRLELGPVGKAPRLGQPNEIHRPAPQVVVAAGESSGKDLLLTVSRDNWMDVKFVVAPIAGRPLGARLSTSSTPTAVPVADLPGMDSRLLALTLWLASEEQKAVSYQRLLDFAGGAGVAFRPLAAIITELTACGLPLPQPRFGILHPQGFPAMSVRRIDLPGGLSDTGFLKRVFHRVGVFAPGLSQTAAPSAQQPQNLTVALRLAHIDGVDARLVAAVFALAADVGKAVCPELLFDFAAGAGVILRPASQILAIWRKAGFRIEEASQNTVRWNVPHVMELSRADLPGRLSDPEFVVRILEAVGVIGLPGPGRASIPILATRWV